MNLKVIIMENNKISFIMRDIIFKNMVGCTNYSKQIERSFWYLTLQGKTTFDTLLVMFSFSCSHFLSLCELTAVRFLWHRICQSKYKKGWKNVAQRNIPCKKIKKAATVFPICIKHLHKAKSKNLSFRSAR